MAEAGDRVCRMESLWSANEYAVRRRRGRGAGEAAWHACWRASSGTRGVSWVSATLLLSLSVRGASTGLMR